MEDDHAKKKGADSNECVSVVVRCRPMNSKEKNESRSSIINIDVAARQVSISNPSDKDVKSFTYDGAYDDTTQQRVFYEESCFGIIESVLEGFNGTIFAYGQTGCGKSFTMQGPTQNPTADMRGVIPNSFSHIFEQVKASTDVEYLIRCSYLEIYNEEVKDLLGNQKAPTKCELKEDPQKGVFVKGLTDVVVETEDQLMAMLDKGLSVRTTASTQMNAESSRSHSIFSVVVEMSTKDLASGKDLIRAGKLNLVDLAGSERQKKTGATGNLLKEGSKINLSLSALGNVISALSEKSKHIPYRDSKLTRLLQDSLGGNTKTLMVAAISPADYNFDETMSTLRYANRAKNIKNKPKINEDPKDTMLREFKEEIERLRKMLADQAGGVSLGAAGVVANPKVKKAKGEAVLDENDDEEEEEEEVVIVKKEKTKKAKKIKTVYVDGEEEDGGDDQLSPQLSDHMSDKFEEKKDNMLEYSYERKGMEEFSQAVVEERDLVNEKLKMKESEIEQERILRMELCERLKELQNKFVGNSDQVQQNKGVATAGPVSQAEVAEREAAKKHMKERRLKAKKKREAKQQEELALAVMEKQAMEDELEELKLATVATGEEKVNELLERRVLKMKKKYEKKISSMRADLVDAAEEFEYQRQIMLDSLKEQEKDTSLYETVCRSLLSEKEFRRMVDKSKWLEEEEEWLIPTLRMKSMDCSSSSSFPGIHNSGASNSSSHANLLNVAGNFSGMMGGSPHSSTDSSSNYPSKKKTISPCNSGPIPPQKQSLNLSLPVGGNSVSLPNLPSARLRDKSPCADVSQRSDDHGSMTARGINRIKSNDRPASKNYGSYVEGLGEDKEHSNDDFQQQVSKKNKKKNKKKKAAKAAALASGKNGDVFAGQVDEWGFAADGGHGHKEPEYSDDEDFEGDEEPEERGDNRGGGGGGGSNGGGYGGKSIPPIDSYHKAKNGGGGLPQIR